MGLVSRIQRKLIHQRRLCWVLETFVHTYVGEEEAFKNSATESSVVQRRRFELDIYLQEDSSLELIAGSLQYLAVILNVFVLVVVSN